MRIELGISGMTCGGCRTAVERILRAQSGVSDVHVDLDAGKASVEAREDVIPEQLVAAIEGAGYEARLAE